MDKETLSNYGWIVVLVLILAVLLALATPFGNFIVDAIWGTVNGLFDVNRNVLDSTGITIFDTSKPEPILAANSTWFNPPAESGITRASITEIEIKASYTPEGTESVDYVCWDASEGQVGTVTAYVEGTKLTIAGNGHRCIYANPDASCTFSNIKFGNTYNSKGTLENINLNKFDKFNNVSVINGLEYLDVSKAETMLCMFSFMNNLTSFTGVTNWDTSNVTSMANMFHECYNLTSLKEIGKWNTGSVEDMDHIFASKEHATEATPNTGMNLTEIDVSNWDVSNVRYMGSMFYGCYKLTKLDLNKWNTSKLYDMNHIFTDCNNLTELKISNWDVSNCQFFAAAFNDCKKLTTIDLSGWDTKNARTFAQMFERCTSLTNIIGIEKFNTSMLGRPFTDPQTGNEINVGENIALFETFYGCSSLTELDLSSFDTSNVDSMEAMFSSCYYLTNIIGIENFETSKVNDMGEMFSQCYRLKSLNLSNFDTSNVTNMEGMFYHCEKLMNVTLSNFDTSNVTNMQGMFAFCHSLENLDLSNFDTSNVTNMYLMFNYCDGLTELDISNFNTKNVTNMGGLFSNCTAIETIHVSDKWSIISATEDSDMFLNCTSLVGGANTTYDPNHVDISYAKIDGGTEDPGYFTSILDKK